MSRFLLIGLDDKAVPPMIAKAVAEELDKSRLVPAWVHLACAKAVLKMLPEICEVVDLAEGDTLAKMTDSRKAVVQLVKEELALLPAEGAGSDSGQATAIARLELALHKRFAHPDFEYETVQTARKSGDDPRLGLEGDGWEPNDIVDMPKYENGEVVGQYPRRSWERFEFHEDNYWRRRKK